VVNPKGITQPPMKQSDILKLVREGEIESLLEVVFSGVPYAFENRAEYEKFKRQLGTALGVDPGGVVLHPTNLDSQGLVF
jgi:hypothetical protein